MFVRFGTILSLIRDVLGEPQSAFVKRLRLPGTTVTAYQAGTRFPRNDLPTVFQATNEFLQETLPELGWDSVDAEKLLMETLNLEKALRRLISINPVAFQKASTKLLFSIKKAEKPVPEKCLADILCRTGEKEQITAYFIEMGRRGEFLESSGGFLKHTRFVGLIDFHNIIFAPIDEMPFIVSEPLCLDILIALPEKVEIAIDNNSDYEGFLYLTESKINVKASLGKLPSIKW